MKFAFVWCFVFHFENVASKKNCRYGNFVNQKKQQQQKYNNISCLVFFNNKNIFVFKQIMKLKWKIFLAGNFNQIKSIDDFI